MTEKTRLWARVVRGLEWIVAAEASRLDDVSAIELAHRDVLFDCRDATGALTLRCADDVYAIWFELHGIDHTRAALAELVSAINRIRAPAPAHFNIKARNLRVTASFVGRRNYSRFEVEDTIGPLLAARLGLNYISTALKTDANAVWCRVHLSELSARIGLRLGASPLHRRPWRVNTSPGALHPPIAAAMVLLADYAPGQVVIDPFIGSGTLLIESGLTCEGLRLEGADVSSDAVANANANSLLAKVDINLRIADALSLARSRADRVISNPPWGVAVALKGKLSRDAITKLLLELLAPSGRAVFIGDRDLDLPAQTRQAGANPHLVVNVRASGRIADIVVVGGAGPFGQSSFAAALSQYWSKRVG